MKKRYYLDSISFENARSSQFLVSPTDTPAKECHLPKNLDIPDEFRMGKILGDTKKGKVGFTSLQTKEDVLNYVYTKQQMDAINKNLYHDTQVSIDNYVDFLERTAAPKDVSLSVTFSIVSN